MVTFQVDDVAPSTTRLPTWQLEELWRDTLAFGGDHLRLRRKAGHAVYCLIDLPDGRCIGHQCDPRTGATRWYLCTIREPPLDESRNRTAEPREISKAAMIDLGASLAEILDAALDADGAIDDHGVIAPGVAQPRPSAP